MTMLRCITRVCVIYVLAISQVVFAYAHAAMPLSDSAGETIVICGPNGPQEIEWSIVEDDPPALEHGEICPLCILGAAIAPPLQALTEDSTRVVAASHCVVGTVSTKAAQAAPYPARAPPA